MCRLKSKLSGCFTTNALSDETALVAVLSFSLFQPWDCNYFLSWNSFLYCWCLYLMLEWNGFERLHQYRFSFIHRNPLVWWYFRLAARHFTESSLIWPFFDFLNRLWFLRKFLVFFASYSSGYLWKRNRPLEKVRFYPDDCRLRSRQHQHFCSRLNVDLLFH